MHSTLPSSHAAKPWPLTALATPRLRPLPPCPVTHPAILTSASFPACHPCAANHTIHALCPLGPPCSPTWSIDNKLGYCFDVDASSPPAFEPDADAPAFALSEAAAADALSSDA